MATPNGNGHTREIAPSRSGASLPQYLNQAQKTFITQKTPRKFIKTRPGPGGMPLRYVEVGYVINILNQAFGWDWDFRILDQQVGKRQVWVRGELSVRVGERTIRNSEGEFRSTTIIKGQYGGAEIKANRQTGEPISIADDLKAAASDCLKKCASLIGVAGDLYWRDLDNWESPSTEPEKEDRTSNF